MANKKKELKNELLHDRTKNATFLPSISNMYVATLANDNVNRDVPCLGKDIHEVKTRLNHLTSEGIFTYPYALYSAGHAKDVTADDAETYKYDKCMIAKRDDNTFILGDSGGYQFGTGANKYPWGDKEAQKAIQLDTLRWLEKTCDAAMTLDLPPWIATRNKEAMKAGLATYEDCRNATLEALETFFRNRTPGATKFLNVLQGETEDHWNDWFDHVIKYSDKSYWSSQEEKDKTFEGFAFAGRQSYCMYAILKALLKLLDGGYLNHGPILHFLGSGKLNAATAFSRIQEMLRLRTNSDIMITFDAASPYLSAASGKVYSDIVINSKEVTYKYNSLPATSRLNKILFENEATEIPDFRLVEGIPPLNYSSNEYTLTAGKHYTGTEANKPVWLRKNGGRSSGAWQNKIHHIPLLWNNSPVVKDIKNKDIYIIREGEEYIEKEVEKKGKKVIVREKTGKKISSVQIDSLAYAIAMAHNVYMHIKGIEMVNDIFNNSKWDMLPRKYKKMDELIQKIFSLPSNEALELIESQKTFLLEFTGKGRRQQALTRTNFNEHISTGTFSKKNG